jgi:acetyl/propionyl-CoA carboxylase alpha subunit
MRVVEKSADFADALQAARKEAKSSFGDDHVIVEKYFTEIHHVEIQVLGDQQGKVLHLFERECSVQRRHQKIIEESPSPIMTEELRGRMAAAAVSLAQAVNYVSAGTVEFIVDEAGGFYFLEMNTRLQVEHPVTELVTGLDLAAWQIRIAMGEALPYEQADLRQRGHAIECRVYAEDPANHFLPSIGEIVWYERPSGPGIRVDDGIETGTQVTPYYDPMLAKVITWGQNRAEAIAKMEEALSHTVVLGLTTNIPYLLAILREPHFVAGNVSTNYLAEHMADWQANEAVRTEDWLALAAVESFLANKRSGRQESGQAMRQPDPWQEVTGWRNVNSQMR